MSKTYVIHTVGGRTYRRRKDGKFIFGRWHAMYLVLAPWSPAYGGAVSRNRYHRLSPHPDRVHKEKP